MFSNTKTEKIKQEANNYGLGEVSQYVLEFFPTYLTTFFRLMNSNLQFFDEV